MTSLAASERIAQSDARPSPAERLLGMIEHSHVRLCAVLVLLSLACFLPGFASLQPMDRDEPRYAQASKQMLESGDFVDIRFQDEARHKKPVGIYWMQSAAVAVGRGAGRAEARTHDRALPDSVAPRARLHGAADLLGGLGLHRAARGVPGGRLHGRRRHPDGRGAAGQDRCGADRLLRRRDGRRSRAGLSRAAVPAPARADHGDLLARPCRRHPRSRDRWS